MSPSLRVPVEVDPESLAKLRADVAAAASAGLADVGVAPTAPCTCSPLCRAFAGAEPPAAPAMTEPGCSHPLCKLNHPHAGPAVLDAATDLGEVAYNAARRALGHAPERLGPWDALPEADQRAWRAAARAARDWT